MEIDILRIDKDKKKNLKDIVTEEVTLAIYLNGKRLYELSCSPDNLKELSVGFLYSKGLIKSMDEIESIVINRQNYTSHIKLNDNYSAGENSHRKIETNDFKLSAEKILELMRSFDKRCVNFRKTGGVHSAALSDGEKITIFKEDIGRHNVLDKVAGCALIKGLSMQGLIVLSSCRISTEIISKVEKMKAAFLISRSAPTDQAVKLAEKLNLTLIGFARDERMNIYSLGERIL